MDTAGDEAGLQLYEDLADHPELLDKTTKALLERPDVSGLSYMASYAESSAAFIAAARPAGEPEANSKPVQEVAQAALSSPPGNQQDIADVAAIPEDLNFNAASPESTNRNRDCSEAAAAAGSPSTSAVHRRATKECLLVIFQWNRRPEALHVLREKGADACTSAIWARQLQARTFPLPVSARRHKWVHKDGWRGLARLRHLKSGGAAGWVADAAEGNMLREHGATKRGRGMRMLSVKVVLEQLEGSCAEWKEDLAALKTALATVQPLSAAETTEKYKQHLAHQKEDKAQRSWPEQLEQALLLAKGNPAANVRDNVQHQIDEAQGNTAGIASDARQLQAQEAWDAALSEDSVPLNKLRHNRQQQQMQGAAPGNAALMEGSADPAGQHGEKHQQQVQGDAAEDVAALEDSGGAPLTIPAALVLVGTLAGGLAPPPRTSGMAPTASAGLANGCAGPPKQPPEALCRTVYPPGKGKTRPPFPGIVVFAQQPKWIAAKLRTRSEDRPGCRHSTSRSNMKQRTRGRGRQHLRRATQNAPGQAPENGMDTIKPPGASANAEPSSSAEQAAERLANWQFWKQAGNSSPPFHTLRTGAERPPASSASVHVPKQQPKSATNADELLNRLRRELESDPPADGPPAGTEAAAAGQHPSPTKRKGSTGAAGQDPKHRNAPGKRMHQQSQAGLCQLPAAQATVARSPPTSPTKHAGKRLAGKTGQTTAQEDSAGQGKPLKRAPNSHKTPAASTGAASRQRPSPAQLPPGDAGQAPAHGNTADQGQGTGRPQYAEAILAIPRKLAQKATRSMQVDCALPDQQRKRSKSCAKTKTSGRAPGPPDVPNGAPMQAPTAAEQPQDEQAMAAAAYQEHFEERKASLLKLQAAFIQESMAYSKPLTAKIRAQQVIITRLQQQTASMHAASMRDKEKLQDLQQKLTRMTSKYGVVRQQLKEQGG